MKVEALQDFNIKKALAGMFLIGILYAWRAIFYVTPGMIKKGLFLSEISRFRELITRKYNVQLVDNKCSGDLIRDITTIRQPITYSVFHFFRCNLLLFKIGPKQGIFSIFDLPPSS